MGGESLPHPGNQLIQGGLAAQVIKQRGCCLVRPPPGAGPVQGDRAHEMFLIRPTTRPSTRTSRLRIGSIAAFSG
jgi:hypothetical protein